MPALDEVQSEASAIDDLMIGIKNGTGVLAMSGREAGGGLNYQTQTSIKLSENCFSTYNTPKFRQAGEFFPQLNVKKNPNFGQL